MVRWFRQKIAVNDATGHQVGVYTGASEWDEEIHPTLFFEYFNNLPIFNTFQLMFVKFTKEGLDKGEIIDG